MRGFINLKFFSLLSAVSLLHWAPLCLGAGFDGLEGGEKGKLIPFSMFLEKCREKLGVHFTIETFQSPAYKSPLLLWYSEPQIPEALTPDSVGTLVKELRSRLRGCDASISPENKMVIHISDGQLASIPDYALNKHVTLDFKGYLALGPEGEPRLVDAISKKIPALTLRRGGAINRQMIDSSTKVSVKGTNLAVRSIFTDSIDLETYSSVLWLAETVAKEASLTTTIAFSGPRLKAK